MNTHVCLPLAPAMVVVQWGFKAQSLYKNIYYTYKYLFTSHHNGNNIGDSKNKVSSLLSEPDRN